MNYELWIMAFLDSHTPDEKTEQQHKALFMHKFFFEFDHRSTFSYSIVTGHCPQTDTRRKEKGFVPLYRRNKFITVMVWWCPTPDSEVWKSKDPSILTVSGWVPSSNQVNQSIHLYPKSKTQERVVIDLAESQTTCPVSFNFGFIPFFKSTKKIATAHYPQLKTPSIL